MCHYIIGHIGDDF